MTGYTIETNRIAGGYVRPQRRRTLCPQMDE
jgi:hypothetical protein